ncbi:MAG: hypothetical protein ACKVG1_14875 [Rhodospirillales bacterium]
MSTPRCELCRPVYKHGAILQVRVAGIDHLKRKIKGRGNGIEACVGKP